MKETTFYVCEICKTRYANRQEAEKYEAAHIKPKKLAFLITTRRKAREEAEACHS